MPEFTDELDEQTLAAIRRKIKEDEARRIAEAQGQAAKRGLTGGSFEAIRTSMATQGAQRAEADAMANLALERAKMKREERMIGEERGYRTGERLGAEKFQTGERVGGELHRTGERLGGEKFLGGENLLGRQAEAERLKTQQEWQATEADKQRAGLFGEAAKAREFEGEQNRLTREGQLALAGQDRQTRLELAGRESEGRMLEEGVGSLGKGLGGMLGGLFKRKAPAVDPETGLPVPGGVQNLKRFGRSLFPGGVKPGQTKIGAWGKSIGSKGLGWAKGLGSKLPGGQSLGGLGGLMGPAAIMGLWQNKKLRDKTKKLLGKGATSTLIKPLGQTTKELKRWEKKLFRF